MPEKLLAQTYQPLTNITNSFDRYLPPGSPTTGFGLLISQIFTFFLVAAVVLAVVMIVFGGFQYMTSSDSGDKKSRAKSRITGAFWGLILALSTILILSTINPNLTGFNLDPKSILSEPEQPKNTSLDIENGFRPEDIHKLVTDPSMRIKFNDLSDKELENIVINQTSTVEGREEFQNFLISALERRGRLGTNQRDTFLDGLINRFIKPDTGGITLDADIALENFNNRILLGLYSDNYNMVNGVQINERDFNLGLSTHSRLFFNEDNRAIEFLYQSNGGNNLENSYRNGIIRTLNLSDSFSEGDQRLTDRIEKWVERNGERLGIGRNEDGLWLTNIR